MRDERQDALTRIAGSRLVQWSAAIAVGVVGIPTAHAGYKALSLPYYQQQQSEWCAIASAEMLLGFYGSQIQQCEMANYDFGRSDCCSTPSSSTCNPTSGSFTGTPISHFGLSYLQWPNNSFSYSQFKSEIDAGRPVSIGWNWNCSKAPCGGHAMNVAGYYDYNNTQYLEVWDPQPGAGCPAGEDECWLTYATYMGGATYNHVAQAPLYDIKFSPVCNADYFDLPGSEMQQCFDTWTHRGRRPTALTATNYFGNILYSGAYSAVGGAYYQYTGMSISAYQTQFNTMLSQGYRPDQVSLVQSGSGWIVNAIFVPTEGTFYSYTGLNPATFNSYNSYYVNNGYVIVDLFGYNDSGNNPYYAATWVKTASQGQFAEAAIPAGSYQAVFNSQVSAGRRPTRVSAYSYNGAENYAVIWQNDNGVGFVAANGWSEASFAQDDVTQTGAGLHLSYVSALNNTFSGVWTK